MEKAKIDLTDAEWQVMECLWAGGPLTGREAAEELERRMGWSRSTVLTLLRRLEEKGAAAAQAGAGCRLFRALIRREDAARQETERFLDRVYQGSLSLLVNTMAEKQPLSPQEIGELYAILQKAEEAHHA